jgi:hypothetical protein
MSDEIVNLAQRRDAKERVAKRARAVRFIKAKLRAQRQYDLMLKAMRHVDPALVEKHLAEHPYDYENRSRIEELARLAGIKF